MCRISVLVVVALLLGAGLPAGGQQVQVLCDFEAPADLRLWEVRSASAALSDQHATHGSRGMRISTDDYITTWRLLRDWSAYDSLELDLFVEGAGPVAGSVLVADTPWQQKGGTYWNRHNGAFNLVPGANTISLPVHGLFRGEAGSRNNDIKSNIDPKQVIRFDLGFKSQGPKGFIYVDNLRLVKESRPDGILAFDFGPENQALSPGFTPVSWNTVYGRDGRRFGLRAALNANSARDDTYPTRLYQDFIAMDYAEFIADVPDGLYHAWLVYDDCGYWGGEACRHRKRSIIANDAVAWSEDRGADGPADYLHRFQNIEPHPGDSIWDLYVGPIFQPRRFTAKVTGGSLRLKFSADGPLACKVAALIIYPDSQKAQAEPWVAGIEARNRKEFESRAIFLGPTPKPLAPPPASAIQDTFWIGYPSLEQDVSLIDSPGLAEGKLDRAAAQGQRISFTFAVRPSVDIATSPASAAPLTLTATDLKSPAGAIPAAQIDLRYFHHSTHRGFNSIAYTIGPDTLRPVTGSGLKLAPSLTRQFWITVNIPPATPAGEYTGQVTLTSAGHKMSLPLTVRVLGYALDEPDYLMGFFGASVPEVILQQRGDAAWRELFTTIRQAGMNSFAGGPGIDFTGLTPDGKPKLDFRAVDAFLKLARQAGFTKPINGYSNLGRVNGLHDGYVIGQTGRDWERRTGKPFNELLKIVWTAVAEHARQENWPPIQYSFTDEPRVLEQANDQLELMKAYRQAAPFVYIGGSYSVDWSKSDPFEKAVQDIFRTLSWSSLNAHTQADLDQARALGKDLFIYNQGTSRFSFGAYQFAEMRKGVRGRMQWHLLALHGYQFYDLDGREPDTAMINWGKDGIIPTIHLPRCREGADDLRFAVTLWNLAQKNKDQPAARQAIAWLEQVSASIGVGKNTPPKDFMGDEAFRQECVRHIAALR